MIKNPPYGEIPEGAIRDFEDGLKRALNTDKIIVLSGSQEQTLSLLKIKIEEHLVDGILLDHKLNAPEDPDRFDT